MGTNSGDRKEQGSKWFDEEKIIPDSWSWAILALFTAGLVGWGLLVYQFVQDGPRNWDYRRIPDTPGESAYWTHEPAAGGATTRQMPQLPGARQLRPEEMSVQGKRK